MVVINSKNKQNKKTTSSSIKIIKIIRKCNKKVNSEIKTQNNERIKIKWISHKKVKEIKTIKNKKTKKYLTIIWLRLNYIRWLNFIKW